MLPFWTALNSGMGRRSLLAAGAAVALLLLAFVCVSAREAGAAQEREQRQRLEGAAHRFADTIEARLQAGDAIVEALVDRDAGPDGLLLRERLETTRAYRGLLLLQPDERGVALSGPMRFELTPAQLSTVRSGGSVVVPVSVADGYAALYLLHNVRAAGTNRIGAFEFSPEWLWQSALSGVTQRFHVLGARAGTLYSTADDGRDYRELFEMQLRQGMRMGAVRPLSWQAEGDAWSAVMTVLAPLDGYASTSLAIVAAEPRVSMWLRLDAVGRALPLLVVVGAILTLLLAATLMRAWLPPLAALRRGLGELRAERAVTLRVPWARDEPRQLLEVFNQSAAAVLRRSTTLRTLGEIDSLLLASGEVEEVLDGVLERVRDVTRCRAAGIALIDGNAPLHGRIFVASREGGPLPVSRVSIDASILDTLNASPQGLTIARCEEGRHSFLVPLISSGAQFFWAWPVFAGERLAAVLAVGYDEPAQADASLAAYGTECAMRLGAALSSSARAEALYRQAHFDPLTQLPNRLLFRDRLEQELAAVATDSTRGALLYVDLDHFKKINDSLGHDAGDQVLAITAQRLRACVKEGDTVARLAGDEFTVILRQVSDPAAASTVADRIVETLQLPVNIAGQDHHVRASIGITLYPDDGAEIDELMRNADLAMYRAKAIGRGAAVFFDRKMVTRENRVADSGLYRALKRREFSLYYQPQYSLADGRLLAVEALLRWENGRDGHVRSPRDFVPAAEESGLMVDIGSWVMEAACAQIAAWRDQGLQPPRIAVNIAPQQLREGEIVVQTRRLLDKYGLQGHMLELELTEGAFLDPETDATLAELSRLGVGLTLDDFGTGYSALGHLRRYPVGTVKIDRSFIEDVADNQASAALAETIIVMAHNLGKKVVAEGVETIEQLDFLRERGCDIAQGYYLARPLAATAMAEMLQSRLPGWSEETAAAG
jgi:diguanylate cyclase (GGDEF)-like protein